MVRRNNSSFCTLCYVETCYLIKNRIVQLYLPLWLAVGGGAAAAAVAVSAATFPYVCLVELGWMSLAFEIESVHTWIECVCCLFINFFILPHSQMVLSTTNLVLHLYQKFL